MQSREVRDVRVVNVPALVADDGKQLILGVVID